MPLAIFLIVITYYLTWNEIKGLYQVNNWAIVHAGIHADKLLPKDAVVLAPYQGDSAFLYQINRNGFTLIRNSVEEMRRDDGVNFYVSTSKDTKTAWLMEKYKTLVEDPEYIIIDLRKVNPDFPNPDQKEPLN